MQVLGGQSPDYFIFPNASAFVAVELDPVDVAAALDELHQEGKLERELVSAGDAGEDGELVPGGYRLNPTSTTKRRSEVMSETETTVTEPEQPVPVPPEPEPTESEPDEGGEDDGE